MTPTNKPKNLTIKLIILVILISALSYTMPVPEASPAFYKISQSSSHQPALAWPAVGQAALGAKDYGLLDQMGPSQPVPTASVAKVFTALAVLKQHPLKPGQPGPSIIINQADLDSYETYFRQGGSLVPVALGEQITERQALEALMLPSANNMADTVARWAFGSVDKYLSYINTYNSSIGLSSTHIADASGFSSSTVSTAEDLVKIGQQVIANPVLTEIVAEQQATLPVAGVVHNINFLLGTEGINGIKTGNTDEAGGCYLFSAQRVIAGQNVMVIGTVMGASSLTDALRASRALLVSSDSGFQQKPVATKSQVVGEYKFAWGENVPIVTAKDLSITAWYNKKPLINLSGKNIRSTKKSQPVGTFETTSGPNRKSSDLVAGADTHGPSVTWRLVKRYL